MDKDQSDESRVVSLNDRLHREPNATFQRLDGTLRIVNDDQGRLDDVFGQGVGLVRFERMTESAFWAAIYHPDGKQDKRIVFRISAVERDGKPALDFDWEDDNG